MPKKRIMVKVLLRKLVVAKKLAASLIRPVIAFKATRTYLYDGDLLEGVRTTEE
jgi:hypothetical protein